MVRFVAFCVVVTAVSLGVCGCSEGGGGGGGGGGDPVAARPTVRFPFGRADRAEVDLSTGPWSTTVLLHVGAPDGSPPSLVGFEDRAGAREPSLAEATGRYRLEDVTTGKVLVEEALHVPGLDPSGRFPRECDVRVRLPRLAHVERLTLLTTSGATLATMLLIAPPY